MSNQDERIKHLGNSKDFENILLNKGWVVDTKEYSIEEDEFDMGYHKIIYFIFTESYKGNNIDYHLVYGNDTYRNILNLANIYSCGGVLHTTFITNLSSNINQIDFTNSGCFPDIPKKTIYSTIANE